MASPATRSMPSSNSGKAPAARRRSKIDLMPRGGPPHKPLAIGTRFGRLVTLEPTAGVGLKVLCKCDCGTVKTTNLSSMLRGHALSCGCYRTELIVTHGATRDTKNGGRQSEYRIWSGIKSRCLNPNVKQYKDYGGRGIEICERWRDNFAAFYADMGPRPSRLHSIDRIDNDGHYEPGNCRWATFADQGTNKRTNRGWKLMASERLSPSGLGPLGRREA